MILQSPSIDSLIRIIERGNLWLPFFLHYLKPQEAEEFMAFINLEVGKDWRSLGTKKKEAAEKKIEKVEEEFRCCLHFLESVNSA